MSRLYIYLHEWFIFSDACRYIYPKIPWIAWDRKGNRLVNDHIGNGKSDLFAIGNSFHKRGTCRGHQKERIIIFQPFIVQGLLVVKLEGVSIFNKNLRSPKMVIDIMVII